MAKKRKAPKAAAAAVSRSDWLTCAGYRLEARNSNTEFIYELNVVGSDGGQYFLRVKTLNDRTGLLQRVTRLIADRWPAFDWEFRADDDGSITDVR